MNNLISAALAAGNTPALFVGLGILLVILLFLIANIKIVAQAQVYVIERLGSYHATWQTGPHFLVPF